MSAPQGYTPASEQRQPYEERDRPPMQPPRQSLPSISEALNNGDKGMSINSILTSAAASPPRSQYTTQSPTSPTSQHYPETLKQPPDRYPPHISTINRPYDESYERTTRPPYSPQRTNYNPTPLPPVSGNQIQPPRVTNGPSSHTRPGVAPLQNRSPPSPAYHPYHQSHRSPPPAPPYTHKPYQPPYSSYPPAASTYTSGPPQAPVWTTSNIEQERAEEIQRHTARDSPAPKTAYGESVKRHLDIFEIEMSLNEVATMMLTFLPHL